MLSSCANVPLYDVNKRLNAWKAISFDELIKYWGLPSNQRTINGKHYAEWINKSQQSGNTAITVGTGRSSRSSGIGIGFTLFDLGSGEDLCSRLVQFDSTGKITDISWQGATDYCFELTPDFTKVMLKQTQVK